MHLTKYGQQFIDLNEICAYHSGTFSQTKKNYNTMKKEILAIILGIKK